MTIAGRAGRQRLFDVERPARTPIPAGRELVNCSAAICPRCTGAVSVLETWQPALFVGCGYGATLAEIRRRCNRCGWSLDAERIEVNPRAGPAELSAS